MYRSAARRLFPAALCRRPGRLSSPASFSAPIVQQASFSSGAAGNAQTHKPDNAAASNSSSSSSYSSDEGRNPRATARPKSNWQEEQARVLQASLRHVIKLGWTDAAMIAGAREVGVSPSVVGSFPRKEAALVEFFMDDCLQKLIDIIDTKEDLKNFIPSHRVSKLIRIRLEMQAPYISKWPQALSIQARPLNISTSFKQRALLVDEIWHAAGDEATDVDWYVKRTVLGGIYSTTELYMLTDTSQDFQETWNFLDERVRDAFDLKKTLQEVKYLAEAVGAGMGGPVQGFLNRVLRG
ncbi:ubiquinone biosynthesis COQ9-like protein [Perilla frutescens var. hirtella]|uniref:Ubiquinone biosynthesis protein n=1 Tax=Perilla frutescens var. hirtella TaxID=608512 RepID=A0AAD4P6B9_PERFH|nr:ubiquinone biosynthesis COQ9-like protein [Perilla frutescens var. hirtella]